MNKEKLLGTCSRRAFMKLMGTGLLLGGPLRGLSGCSSQEPLLRVASNVWPGYELMYLASESGFFSSEVARLVEVPSATVCIQLLAAGSIEGAMLTLDEVLTAKADGLELKVVAVLDISMGGDVLMAAPAIDSLEAIRGRRIGVEQSAVGAVMLDAVLHEAGLTIDDVDPVYMTVSQHVDAYINNAVDVLITFEPGKTQLLKEGAKILFDSSRIPGRIIDVLAVLPSAIKSSPRAIEQLIAGHFKARNLFLTEVEKASAIMAKRLQVEPGMVPQTFDGLELPDVAANHALMGGSNSRLAQSARTLMEIMLAGKLLPGEVNLDNLIDSRFLPRA